jgi:hypothetical protein
LNESTIAATGLSPRPLDKWGALHLFDEAIAASHTALHCDPNYLKALVNVARLYHIVVSALMLRRSIFPPKVQVLPALVVFVACARWSRCTPLEKEAVS